MPGHVHWSSEVESQASPISRDESWHCTQIEESASPTRPSSCCSSIDWNEEGRQVQDFLAEDYVELYEAPEPLKDTRPRCELQRCRRRQENTATIPRVVNLKPRSHTPTKFVAAVRFDRESGRRYVNGYEIVRTLGRGAFSTVELSKTGTSPEDMKYYALKTVRKSCLKRLSTGWGPKNNAFTSVKREIAIMKKLDHPNLVSLHQIIDDHRSDKLYMVLEYVDCGPVLRPSPLGRWYEPIDELAARACFRDVLRALEYLHFQGVIHFDIKPENILIRSDGLAKLCDFGVSKVLGSTTSTEPNALKPSQIGIAHTNRYQIPASTTTTTTSPFLATTPAFTAPEMCSPIWQRASAPASAVDIWGLGASLHAMLTGVPPFVEQNDIHTFEAIANNQLDLALALSVSSEPVVLRPLLESLLEKDARIRATVSKAMDSKWTNIHFDIIEPTRYTGVAPVTSAEIDSAVSGINKIALATRIKTAMRRVLKRTRTRLRSREKNNTTSYSTTHAIPAGNAISASTHSTASQKALDTSTSSSQDSNPESPAASYVATSFSADHSFAHKISNHRGRLSGIRKSIQRFKHRNHRHTNQNALSTEPTSPLSQPASADDVRWSFSDTPQASQSNRSFRFGAVPPAIASKSKRPIHPHFEHRLTDLMENDKPADSGFPVDDDYERQSAFAALVDRGRAVSTPTRGLRVCF